MNLLSQRIFFSKVCLHFNLLQTNSLNPILHKNKQKSSNIFWESIMFQILW